MTSRTAIEKVLRLLQAPREELENTKPLHLPVHCANGEVFGPSSDNPDEFVPYPAEWTGLASSCSEGRTTYWLLGRCEQTGQREFFCLGASTSGITVAKLIEAAIAAVELVQRVEAGQCEGPIKHLVHLWAVAKNGVHSEVGCGVFHKNDPLAAEFAAKRAFWTGAVEEGDYSPLSNATPMGHRGTAKVAPAVASSEREALPKTLDAEIRTQKDRVQRLRGGDAQKLAEAESRLRLMRRNVFDAEDTLLPKALDGDTAALAALADAGFGRTAGAIRAYFTSKA